MQTLLRAKSRGAFFEVAQFDLSGFCPVAKKVLKKTIFALDTVKILLSSVRLDWLFR